MQIIIRDIEEWAMAAEKILQKLQHPLLLLQGNLGAGKTTFTQHLLKSLGSNEVVSSPTYTLVNEYQVAGKKIFHFDLYRLQSSEEALDFGIEEYLENGHLCIIEWPEIFLEELQQYPHHLLQIENFPDGRELNFH